jgi:Tol biopolymer transport system component
MKMVIFKGSRDLLKYYLRTFLLPYGLLFLICLHVYKILPQEVKASIFNDWPDGRIAFASNRDGNFEIYTMNPDGSDVVRLTDTPRIDELMPAWSADGEHIAFVSVTGGNYDIEVMTGAGELRRRLTKHSAMDTQPCWSPDGEHLAFASYRSGNAEIYVVDFDGKHCVNISRGGEEDTSPSYEPGGGEVYFLRTYIDPARDRPVRQVYAVGPDGKGIRAVALDDAGICGVPSWSRNGKRMVFNGGVYRNTEPRFIYFKKRNWSRFKRLIDEGGDYADEDPVISPDGRRVAFSRRRAEEGSSGDIYVVDFDGDNVVNLTNGEGDNKYPDWL